MRLKKYWDKLSNTWEQIQTFASGILTDTIEEKTPGSGITFNNELKFNGTDHAGVILNSLTTTQRNALSTVDGMLIYNSTTKTMQQYDGTSWQDVSNTIENFYADTMTVNSGTLDSGTVTTLENFDDSFVSISEDTGADPLNVTLEWSGIEEFDNIAFFGRYEGGADHQVAVEIYNVNTTNWDELGRLDSNTANKWFSYPILEFSSYIDSGDVLVRFRHLENGVITHDLYIDYLALRHGGIAGGGITRHGALEDLYQDDHPQYSRTDGTRNVTGEQTFEAGVVIDDSISGTAILDEDDMASNSATKVPTQKSTKAYVDALLAANDAMVYKGAIDCSTNPDFPAADAGHTYKASVAGKIGGASGFDLEVGDVIICTADGTASGDLATVGANWTIFKDSVSANPVFVTVTATTQVKTDTLVENTPDNGIDIDSAKIKDNTFFGNITVESGETADVSAGTLTLADDQISGDKVEGGTINAVTINTITKTTDVQGGLTTIASSESVNDEASITLPSAKTGWGEVQIGDNEEFATFCFTSAGVVTLIMPSTNITDSDTDEKFCIVQSGTAVALKNRLGSAKNVRYRVSYS